MAIFGDTFSAVLEYFVVSIASRLEACGQVWVAFVLSLLLRSLLWLHFEAPPLATFPLAHPLPPTFSLQSDQMGARHKILQSRTSTNIILSGGKRRGQLFLG